MTGAEAGGHFWIRSAPIQAAAPLKPPGESDEYLLSALNELSNKAPVIRQVLFSPWTTRGRPSEEDG